MGSGNNDFHIGAHEPDDAFGLGNDDRYTGTIDAADVSMAAIQALYDLVKSSGN